MTPVKTHTRKTVRGTSEQAFTLLEVLVALTILIIGIVSVVQLFPRSLLNARIAAERQITAEMANSVLGQIRASSGQALFQNQIPRSLLSVYDTYGLYDGYTTTVQRMNGAVEGYLQRVTLSVNFPDGRTETYVTYVTKQ